MGKSSQGRTRTKLAKSQSKKSIKNNKASGINAVKGLPSVIAAKYVDNFIIDLKFDDGTCAPVDFSVWLSGEIFQPLRKKSAFKKFFLDGSTIAWANGADIAPETLYKVASKNSAAKR